MTLTQVNDVIYTKKNSMNDTDLFLHNDPPKKKIRFGTEIEQSFYGSLDFFPYLIILLSPLDDGSFMLPRGCTRVAVPLQDT